MGDGIAVLGRVDSGVGVDVSWYDDESAERLERADERLWRLIRAVLLVAGLVLLGGFWKWAGMLAWGMF